jgi:hypothetical protein
MVVISLRYQIDNTEGVENMECTLATLIACFSWSGLYVETGVQAQDFHPTRYYSETTISPVMSNAGVTNQMTGLRNYEDQLGGNPYGRFAIGYDVEIGRLAWSLELLHVSSLVSNKDFGVNSVSLNVRWRPFSR